MAARRAKAWSVTFTYKVDVRGGSEEAGGSGDVNVTLYPDRQADWPAAFGFRFGVRARTAATPTPPGGGERSDGSGTVCYQFALAARPDERLAGGRYALLCDYDLCAGALHRPGADARIDSSERGANLEFRCDPRCDSADWAELNAAGRRLYVESDLLAHYTAHGRELAAAGAPFDCDCEDDSDAYWLSVRTDTLPADCHGHAVRLRLRCNRVLSESPQCRADGENSVPYRDMELLLPGAGRPFPVSSGTLSQLDCDTFTKWAIEARKERITRRVLHDCDKREWHAFNEAALRYDDVIVPCRHLDTLLNIGSRWRVAKLLRACERHLTGSLALHPMRKLELAAEHGLAFLADHVVRRLDSGRTDGRMVAIEEYAAATGQHVADMHPDVLDLLQDTAEEQEADSPVQQ